MLLKIVQVGNESLRRKAKTLSVKDIKRASTQRLIDLMIATLRDQPGVGLAAPQIGEELQIIVIEDQKKYQSKMSGKLLRMLDRKPVPLQVIINPRLKIDETDQVKFFEGCLSVNGYRAVVSRAKKVTVKGLDRDGKPITLQASGWLARILQHEIDHLNGTVYVDKMQPRTFIGEASYKKQWENADVDAFKAYLAELEAKLG